MAKRTNSSRAPARKTPPKKAAAGRTATRTTKPRKVQASKPEPAPAPEKQIGAGEVIGKLLESPLMVDLIAVGATAALAAITEHRFSHRAGQEGQSGQAAKAAGKAAAAAMGRRIGVELDEVLKAAKTAKDGGAT